MKQLLFLLLFPCFAMAQYQGNGNQKITLGEQSTADGLVWRGIRADTTSKIVPFSDTSAYIILDTVEKTLWLYKAGQVPKWQQVGGSAGGSTFDTTTLNLVSRFGLKLNISDTSSMLLPYWRSGRFSGVLPVANGGTGKSSLTANKILVGSGTDTIKSPTNLHWDNTNSRLGIGTSSPEYYVHLKNSQPIQLFMEGTSTTTHAAMYFTNSRSTNFTSYGGFLYGGTSQTDALFGLNRNDKLFLFADGSNNLGMIVGTLSNQPLYFGTNNTERMRVTSAGEVWIGYTADQGAYALQINGTPQSVNALVTTSDEKFKENITPLNKGLEIVNKLKPVTFNFISDTKNNFSVNEEVGFIAQDVDRALSTETFAKSIVNSADDSEPTSTMGLATQNLIPILVKAIQEQQALIKALEQRILILENK